MDVQKLYNIDLFLRDAHVSAMARGRMGRVVATATEALRKNDRVGADRAVADLGLLSDKLPEELRSRFLEMIGDAQNSPGPTAAAL